jgi:hypothetical protein
MMEFLATEEYTRITGRTLFVDGMRYLSYSGSSISFTFTGKRAEADIYSDSPDWDEPLKGWMAVYINDGEEPEKRFLLEEREGTYTLFESDKEQTVTVHLVKYSEAAFGKCGVKKLRIDTDKLFAPPEQKKRKIEFIGDSITCGFGVEAKCGTDIFRTATENPAKSYSLRTARLLGAEAQLVSWSGIGVISGWVEEDATAPSDEWLMPMLYEYTDAGISNNLYGNEKNKWEKWEFDRYEPQLIIVNLGTNDASYCKDIPERMQGFADLYAAFLDDIADHNRGAQILCTLGTMDQRLCPMVEQAVRRQQESRADGSRFHYLHLPLQSEADGLGADSHPSDATQQKTAELVAKKARQIMGW